MLFGIDYASHQGWIDFAQLKREGHDFAITKVTGEDNYINPYWRKNHDAARAAGLIVGTYDWVEPQGNLAPDDAAKDYLRVVGDRQPGDLLTVDFETPDWFKGPEGRDIQSWMKAYLYTLKELSGQPVIVYTAPYFLQETGATGWDWLGRDFLYWMAAPGAGMADDNAPWQQPLGPPWQAVTLHQHQWYARSGAIGSGTNFDRNRFNGTREQLAALGKPRTISQAEVIGGSLGKPEVLVDRGEAAATASVYPFVNERGEACVLLNFGGTSTAVLGVNLVDVGISTLNADGETHDRSIKANVFEDWQKRSA